MTDLKTVIQITFPDDGVSIFCAIYVIVHCICYNNNNNN